MFRNKRFRVGIELFQALDLRNEERDMNTNRQFLSKNAHESLMQCFSKRIALALVLALTFSSAADAQPNSLETMDGDWTIEEHSEHLVVPAEMAELYGRDGLDYVLSGRSGHDLMNDRDETIPGIGTGGIVPDASPKPRRRDGGIGGGGGLPCFLTGDCDDGGSTDFPGGGDGGSSSTRWIRDAKDIVNLGKSVFEFIEKGRPHYSETVDFMTAVPRGTEHWTDLDGWSRDFEVFKRDIFCKNIWGMKVMEVNYEVLSRAGGTKDGVGKYVWTTIRPNASAMFGYDISADAKALNLLNVGTRERPIGEVTFGITINFKNLLRTVTRKFAYSASGDFNLREVGASNR